MKKQYCYITNICSMNHTEINNLYKKKLSVEEIKTQTHNYWISLVLLEPSFMEMIEDHMKKNLSCTIGKHYIPLSISFRQNRKIISHTPQFFTKILLLEGHDIGDYGVFNVSSTKMMEMSPYIEPKSAIDYYNKYLNYESR